MAAGKPLIAVNHLEGHALSPRLADPDLDFPYLLLLVSGGHCQLLLVEGVGRYRRLATTIDDAAGEAFDKTAKLLGLGFPGGPAVERGGARRRSAAAVPLPRPLIGSARAAFLVRRPEERGAARARCGHLFARGYRRSFQQAVVDCLIDRTRRALARVAGRDRAGRRGRGRGERRDPRRARGTGARRMACASSRRRCGCAPTMPR